MRSPSGAAFLTATVVGFGLAAAVVLHTEPTPRAAKASDAGCVCACEEAGVAAVVDVPADTLPSLPALPAESAPVDEPSDGGADKPLPANAPRRVRFAVVVVAFAGAEGAPAGAPTRDVARARAEALVADASQDFSAAVRKGDPGSSTDLGQIPRGVLERGLEYAIFTTPVGRVTGPLESPRGFWVVKRIE